jgi:hypothetical protein
VSALEVAFQCVRRGWKIIPVNLATKEPARWNGRQLGIRSATNDPVLITRWYTDMPEAGVGIVCRASGLAVIDADLRNGADLSAIDRLIGDVSTYAVDCPDGMHRYYQDPGLPKLRGQLDKAKFPGHDVKLDGYVLAAGNVRTDGGRYAVLTDDDPAPMPDALIAEVRLPERPPSPNGHGSTIDADELGVPTVPELLTSAGWALHSEHGEETWWTRPGKDTSEGVSAVHNHHGTDTLKVFTTSTALPSDDGTLTRFGVYAHLHHGGDFRAARAALEPESSAPRVSNALEAPPASTVPVLPDDFWNARESLLRIRNAAHAQQCSAPLMLLAVLARVAAATPHLLELPAPIGAPRPLSLFVAGVAPSGAGKTAVNDNARRYFPIEIPAVADQLPLGTGEGLVEAFFEWQDVTRDDGKTKPEKVQTKFGAYYFVDEGQVVAELANRKGATLLATIRTMFSGAQLGNTNADREKRRLINPGFYTVGLLILFQPELARALLDDAAAGTPQRFVWGNGSDPTIPDQPTNWPPPILWEPPRVTARTSMRVDPAILDEIRRGGLARARGQAVVDPLDAHATLVRFKLAGNLALLERRTNIDRDDWRLAHTIMGYSDTVRAGVLTAIRRDDEARDDAATARASRRHLGVITAERQHRIIECAKRIAKKVSDEPDRWVRGSLYKWMSNWRDVFDDALDHATEKHWISEDIEPGQGTDQRRLRPGPERPT